MNNNNKDFRGIIQSGFINNKNQNFSNIRNIHFENRNDMLLSRGETISTTMSEDSFNCIIGVDIYKSLYDENKALRIYMDFIDGTCHNDEKMISELLEKQKNIKLTEFPTGIVTIGNMVVGQEIPYYSNYNTLVDVIGNNDNIVPTSLYIKVLEVLKELLDNQIIYRDIHARNFLIDETNSIVRLIDFEPDFISSDYGKKDMINNLKIMLNKLNLIKNIEFNNNYEKASTIKEIEECVMEKHYILTKNS